jgi:sulfatase maturation enzyme AslB (radical SAM superfamily)
MEPEIPIPTELISQIHLLDQCNLKCTHCYVGDKRFEPRPMPSLETIKACIKTISLLFAVPEEFRTNMLQAPGFT